MAYSNRENEIIIAVLLPTSESALYSTKLRENDQHISSVSSLFDSFVTPGPGSVAIVLSQSREKERFTFGSDHTTNDVLLKHREDVSDNLCYIQIWHAQIYPDPNHDALILYNSSKSNFTARSLTEPTTSRVITNGQQIRLDSGNWHLTLGEGLDFDLKVTKHVSIMTNNAVSPAIPRTRRRHRAERRPPVRLEENLGTVLAMNTSRRKVDVDAGRHIAPIKPTINTIGTARNVTTRRTMNSAYRVRKYTTRNTMNTIHRERETGLQNLVNSANKALQTISRISVSSTDNPEIAVKDTVKSSYKRQQTVTRKTVDTSVEAEHKKVTSESPAVPTPLISTPSSELLRKTDRTTVFRSTQRGLAIVIKLFRDDEVISSAHSWRNEVNMLCKLDHRSITKILEHDAQCLSLTLEYVGPNLAQFIDKQMICQLPVETHYHIWKDVTCAINYIHEKKVIHLDIKPENILLKGKKAVLCDFELSMNLDERSREKTPLINSGTPCYIPPEYLFSKERDFAGDVWAFGVTLLFVFGLIPLPRGDWKIADILKEPKIKGKMIDWLNKVQEAEQRIPESYRSLRKMLTLQPRARITASKLASLLDCTTEMQVAAQNTLLA